MGRAALPGLLLVLLLAGCAGLPSGAPRSEVVDNHVRLGLAYLKEGNREAARRHLLRAIDLDPRSAEANHGMALLLVADTEYELADEHFRRALAARPDFTSARNNYAVFLYERGKLEEAYRQYKRASEDLGYSGRPQVFHGLGVVAARLGRREEARAAWEKAIALRPAFALPYLELAEYHFEAGEVARARRYLEAFDRRASPVPRSLWLWVRIADRLGDRDLLASKGLALTKLFPASLEARRYREQYGDPLGT